MLRFDDFFHLPEVDPLVARLAAERRGLIVVAGIDPRASVAAAGAIMPSGRATVFRALVGELLAAAPRDQAIVVAENREAIRVPRSFQRRVARLEVTPRQSYAAQIAAALARRPNLLVIDHLSRANVPAAFAAAEAGMPVVSQLDTPCCGAEVERHLRDLGAAAEQIGALRWVVTVQRVATLCPVCRQSASVAPAQLARVDGAAGVAFFDAPGCAACGFSGRHGDAAVFDIYDAAAGADRVSSERYLLGLAGRGLVSFEDVLHHDADRLYRTYRLLSDGERALDEANRALQRKIAELESANQVLQQRTAALLSLQDIGLALSRSSDLGELADRICRHARELCGADRIILYLRRPPRSAAVLAVSGWDAGLLRQELEETAIVCEDAAPSRFEGWPPGVREQHADVTGFTLRAGLRAPLVADGRQVGLMIVQSTQKPRFTPAETALLESFATQAALAIQQAALIEARVQRERLARDLELAREVQQSVLPRVFPPAPGYTFAADNWPARQVGGDFYDVFALDEGHIGVVIGDVSDKGMPAALYMALTRSLLLAEARREPSPRVVLRSVNRLLRELGDPHMFVTVFYGVIDLHAHVLTYARGGHDYPLLLRDGAAAALGGAGMVLGCFDDDPPISEERLALAPGDRLVLYTDGMTDALAPNGARYDLQRLTEVVLRHTRDNVQSLCAATFDALAAFQGTAEQFDDMTLLVVGVAA